jgi:hypothetical protein
MRPDHLDHPAATMNHACTNLLEETETASGADVLGRVLGHAITADTGTEWHQYTRLLWPAIADAPHRFTRVINAALDVCDDA